MKEALMRRLITLGTLSVLSLAACGGPGAGRVAETASATTGSGVLSNTLFRAALGPFNASFGANNGSVVSLVASSNADGDPHDVGRPDGSNSWSIAYATNADTDIVTQDVVFAPGGYSGWHSHPGPAVVSVKSGTATFYQASDPSCGSNNFPAGTGFVESPNQVHIARNEGSGNLELLITYTLPHGAAQRVDQPNPGNCPF
jgi:quercetin dioxygenase-like cupin family protein